jgi:hypothetical protein
MRTARSAVVCLATLILASALTGAAGASGSATVKPVPQPQTYSGRVRQFLYSTETPVLFVGKLTWVYSDYLPCKVQNRRTSTWSVSKVLYGFDPGKKIDVGFGSCGPIEPQFKSPDEMLVIAYPGYRNVWIGMPESVVPATDANIRIARKVMDDYLRGQIRGLVWPRGAKSPRPILVLEGTILDPGPKRDPDAPCISTVPPTFPVKFQVDQIMRGDWSEKEVAVGFPGCGPLDPRIHVGQPVLVLALRIQPEPPAFFRAGFLLPVEQRGQLEEALRTVEAIPDVKGGN